MMHLADVRFTLVPKEFWMEIVPQVLRRLVHFHLDAMGVGPGVLGGFPDSREGILIANSFENCSSK
jgi:hypothetical protein